MKRYRLFLVVYFIILVFFVATSMKVLVRGEIQQILSLHQDSSSGRNEYWFSISFDGRFWMVNKDARIFDLHSPEDFSFPVVVTNVEVDPERGRVKGVKNVLPEQIPDFVYEINFKDKYVTLDNSAIIKLLSLSDLSGCIKVLKITHQYLSPKVIYLFNNGKIYKIG